jgi:hypothetical protein
MVKIQHLPQVLALFTRTFRGLLLPEEVNLELLWGLIYLNLKVSNQRDSSESKICANEFQLSYLSSERLKRTTDFLHKIRRQVDFFTRSLEVCEESNEARIAAVDFMAPFIDILVDSVIYLHEYSFGL